MAAGEEEVVGPGAGDDAEKVREFFNQFDKDGGGNLSPEEFKELCQPMQPDMPDEDVAAALEQLETEMEQVAEELGAIETLMPLKLQGEIAQLTHR